MNFVFFTLRDFKREGGGTIRMYGVLNALAKVGANVTFISNAEDYSKFHPAIKHVLLGTSFPRKAFFQALLALFPSNLVAFLFQKSLTPIIQTITKNTKNSKLFFFEYLDNSLGYLLKKEGNIREYYNDIHGIATVEFDYQGKNSNDVLRKIIFRLKFYLADSLDRKVMQNATGIIYSSKAMEKHFEKKYNLTKVKSYILPNLLADEVENLKVDIDLARSIKEKYAIKDNETVLFFAGGYKPTAGVDDLVQVFNKLNGKFNNLRLLLIGSGPLKKEVLEYVQDSNLQNQIIFIDRVDYYQLVTYQSLADIIICPDKMNEFSNMILHLKYLDSLMSNKVVLNGSFESVLEINPDEELSVNFTPSDTDDLYNKLSFIIENKEMLIIKYQNTRTFALQNLTYSSSINTLTK